MVGALILAAGAGKRIGVPKALLELEGIPFLTHATRTCRAAGCDPLWTVIPPDSPAIERLALSLDLLTAANPEPARGMFSSVVAGLDAALERDPSLAGIVIFPVDHPRVRSTTVLKLVRALAEKPEATWVRPTYRGKGGHPIALDARTARALLDHDPTGILIERLRTCGLSPFDLPVDDPAILENMNRPEDLPGVAT